MAFCRCRVMLSVGVLCLGLVGAPAARGAVPEWLPRYDLDVRLRVGEHTAIVHERVTWTNRHAAPARELVFNAHSRYQIPDGQGGFLAKSLEILRLAPSEALSSDGPACDVQKVFLLEPAAILPTAGSAATPADTPLPAPRPLPRAEHAFEVPFHFREDNATALVVPLPRPVAQGESVCVAIDFVMRLPQKQGRWGQWQGVTFLSNWLPVLAFYDDHGWQPTPFIPWHQPFFNEAGVYHARVTLPADHAVACSGSVVACRDLGNGTKEVDVEANGARDFAFLCSPRYREWSLHAGPVLVRCVAFPEHEHYAQEMLRIAGTAIEAYGRWFGPYPYPEFTVVESYFGWNGNECAGLVMIDERIFAMPHLACAYVDGLVSHETCHQWWYNVVGTNGYCETWMDEALATYFSYRLMREKHGKNDPLLDWPKALHWLPQIYRDNYHYAGLYGTIGRGECTPTVQEMPKFGHLVNLFSMTYDRGSKIVGMIEDRLGEAAFLDFMHLVYARYQFRILRVADFQRELEAYTGRSWGEFFQHWLYGAGMTDWAVDGVHVEPLPSTARARQEPGAGSTCLPAVAAGHGPAAQPPRPCRVVVRLSQRGEYTEPTVLGFCLNGGDAYQVRIPIVPQALPMQTEDPDARIERVGENGYRVEIVLPCRPTQVAVDPDQVLLDRDPTNNYWKPRVRCRFAPVYTQLEETDLTNDYDRWNLVAGPWLYGAAYDDPWFTRSARAGVRAGLYRTQQFDGGAYLAFRPDERDVVVGADALWDHWPWPHTQVGVSAEAGVTPNSWGQYSDRAVLFGRYVLGYSSSLYLPPMHYVEIFGALREHDIPPPDVAVKGAEPFEHQRLVGVHYHLDYLTPYWDPEGGFRLDATYSSGLPILGEPRAFNEVQAQFSWVHRLPDGLGYFSRTRLAARIYGAAGLPDDGEYFALGGSTLLRGFDLDEREGNAVWVGSLEWRLPVAEGLTYDCLDHTIGLRGIYGAAFYDVGEAFANGHSVGGVAHAVGGGVRLDVAWFSFVERTIIRFDVAKALNASAPLQFWFGVGVPF